MFKCLFTIIFLFLCFDISVISVNSVNVSPPRPVPIPIPIPFTYNLPCQPLVKSRVVLRTFFSYKYLTVDLIKFIFLVFLWVLILSPNITRNVRYVNFYWNLSILPRHYETNILFNHSVKSSVYVCTFLSLYEPFLLFFVIDKSILSYFPSVNTVVALNKCLYSKIHRTCFLTFNCMIMSIVTFLSTQLSIPCATLWYFQLVIYLRNDI